MTKKQIAGTLCVVFVMLLSTTSFAAKGTIWGGEAKDLKAFGDQMYKALTNNCSKQMEDQGLMIQEITQSGCWYKAQVGITPFSEQLLKEVNRPKLLGGAAVPFSTTLPPYYIISQKLDNKQTEVKIFSDVKFSLMPGEQQEVWWKEIYTCGTRGGGVQWNYVNIDRDSWIRGEGGEMTCRHFGYFWTKVKVQKTIEALDDQRAKFKVQEEIAPSVPTYDEKWKLD